MNPCYGRRLSDMEWSIFLDTVDVLAMNLPPWGGVYNWDGVPVLMLVGPPRDDVTNYVMSRPTNSEIFLTDITGCDEFLATLQSYGSYDPNTARFWSHLLPETWDQTKDTVTEAFVSAPQQIRDRLQQAADEAGKAAASAVKPVLELLSPVLIGALVLLGIIYLPRHS